MAKLSKTSVVYNGETFELGSEEAKIIYTALKALNDGTAQTDGVGLSINSYTTGSTATSFINDSLATVAANQLFITASTGLTNAGGVTGSGDYFVMLRK